MDKFFKSKLYYYLVFAALGFFLKALFGFEWAVILMLAWIIGDFNHFHYGKD